MIQRHGGDDAARAQLRCSHTDREAVAERLREAAGDGRLELDELEERLERAFAAKTYGELDGIVSDLPDGHAPSAVEPADVMRLSATLADRKQEGHWVVPRHIVAEAGVGTVKLDFTEAVCPHSTVHITVRARVGNVVLVVPEGWSVRTDQVATGAGSVKNRTDGPPAPGSPVLELTGHAGVGDVIVRHPRRSRWLPR